MALYHAKEEGRNGYRFFEPSLNGRAVQRQSIEAGLRRALDRQEFELVYQPKIDLKINAIVGAEALLRWRQPDGRLVEPAAFLSIAEDCGLMGPIGQWVLGEACRQARAWQDAGHGKIPVAVNISAGEFRHQDLAQQIADILHATSLDPRALEIEFTERVLMTEVDATRTTLGGLHTLGVQLALDGFGTGWSSLNYLRRFPIDALKIDTSFVQHVTTDAKAALIVGTLIRLGQGLTSRVIAAGVETPAQLAFLRAEQCDEAQGYPSVARSGQPRSADSSILCTCQSGMARHHQKVCMTTDTTTTAPGTVALFNASDDTIDMVQKLLSASSIGRRWSHVISQT